MTSEQKTGATVQKGRVLRGTVVASKMTDTCTVAVERYIKHPKYKKFQRRTKKFLVHDISIYRRIRRIKEYFNLWNWLKEETLP